MEFNWATDSYRDIINDYLGYRHKRRPRGAIKKLADQLHCHPTFLAQVLNEKANLSMEQALTVAQFYEFSREELEYFLLVLQLNRAGTKELRVFLKEQINKLRELHRDLQPRDQKPLSSLGNFEAEYFSHWLYQMIHGMTQITRWQKSIAIAKALNLAEMEIKFILARLEVMGLVKQEKGQWKCLQDSMHLAKDSPFIRSLHSTWKTKILSDFQSSSNIEGTHFSGILAVSESDYQKIREQLVKFLNNLRKTAENSEPQNVYLLSIDCYQSVVDSR